MEALKQIHIGMQYRRETLRDQLELARPYKPNKSITAIENRVIHIAKTNHECFVVKLSVLKMARLASVDELDIKRAVSRLRKRGFFIKYDPKADQKLLKINPEWVNG
mgnify:CR=1 FL=1